MSKKWLFVILIFTINSYGQTNPNPSSTPNTNDIELKRQNERTNATSRDYERNTANGSVRIRAVPSGLYHEIKEIYRDSTKKEKKSFLPLTSELLKFKDFLKQKNTGIIKMAEFSGCGDDVRVVSASTICSKYTMPGSGAHYSFRKEDYVISRLADLRFENDTFISRSVLQIGVITGLGFLDLEKIDISSAGIKHLTELVVPNSFDQVMEFKRRYKDGIDVEGFYYSSQVNVVENMTYAIRSVAYRGTSLKSFKGYVYDEFEFDNRSDIFTFFKVVKKHDDGTLTVVWKRLQRKAAPVLSIEETNINDIKTDKYAAYQF